MVQNDPKARPTMNVVVERFDSIRQQLSSWKLRSRVIARDEDIFETVYRSATHWRRRIGFIVKRAPAVPRFQKWSHTSAALWWCTSRTRLTCPDLPWYCTRVNPQVGLKYVLVLYHIVVASPVDTEYSFYLQRGGRAEKRLPNIATHGVWNEGGSYRLHVCLVRPIQWSGQKCPTRNHPKRREAVKSCSVGPYEKGVRGAHFQENRSRFVVETHTSK